MNVIDYCKGMGIELITLPENCGYHPGCRRLDRMYFREIFYQKQLALN